MPEMRWNGEQFSFPALEIPQGLWLNYRATKQIQKLFNEGVIERTMASVERWINAGSSVQRRSMYRSVQEFLSGRKIEEADTILMEHYIVHLSTPKARASLFLAHVIASEQDAVWVPSAEGDEWVVPLLERRCVPALRSRSF